MHVNSKLSLLLFKDKN